MTDWQPFDWFLSSDGDYGVISGIINGKVEEVFMIHDGEDGDTYSSFEAVPNKIMFIDGVDIPEKYRNAMADNFKYTIEDIT